MTERQFTGYQRARTTRRSVRVMEVASRTLISVGGIGTIAAVALIFVFLVSVVLPLFTDARVDDAGAVELEGATPESLALLVDEHQSLAVVLGEQGRLTTFSLEDGAQVSDGKLLDRAPTCASATHDGRGAVFGFGDGTLRRVDLDFVVDFPPEGSVPLELAEGERAAWEGGIVEMAEGRLRQQRLERSVSEPIPFGRAPLRMVDLSGTDASSALVALDADDRLAVLTTSTEENMLTGEEEITTDSFDLPYEPGEPGERGVPAFLLIDGQATNVFLIWKDGHCQRFDVRDPAAPQLAQIEDLVPEPGESLTHVEFLIGRTTMVAADTAGKLRGWFVTKPDDAGTVDGSLLSLAKDYPVRDGQHVTALAPSPRSRLLLAGYDDGHVALYQTTSARTVGSVEATDPPDALCLFPKENGLVSLSTGSLERWSVDVRYPEASFASLFQPVWYEGYASPDHVWQSSSGTDDFEEKLGLVPLVFGTLKATFYSMLFGAPLALLAAIFTSEFLDRRLRTPIKSSIEVMASLPSVVLGFLAALVVAPFVQSVLPATMALMLCVPFALLLGAYAWQLMPRDLALRLAGWPRLACIIVALPVSVLLATGTGLLEPVPLIGRLFAAIPFPGVGAWIQDLFFAGDMELWLDGQVGSGFGGWVFLLLPVSALLVAVFFGRVLAPMIRQASAGWSAPRAARVELGKFGVGAILTVALSLAIAAVLEGLALDPRHLSLGLYEVRPVGTYIQRNAMIVGFAMGFAVVPIIYTLSEDALSSVPEQLRLASLGAGATQWQTAVRIIVPTAASGLFSAMMVGLGRAVGETMVVLMATGNTAILDLNVFNGFRTLSANIAVELPEAVKDSTHYRTLFLAALVLFAITFVVNTVAEVVRQHFRKRAFQL